VILLRNGHIRIDKECLVEIVLGLAEDTRKASR
jgi:hypothetical protein